MAAGAAVQAAPRSAWPAGVGDAVAVFAVIGRAVPDCDPATSYGGEAHGLLLAASRLARPPAGALCPRPPDVESVTDCLNALRRLEAYRASPPSPADSWAGTLGAGGRGHWLGNAVADWAADFSLQAAFADGRAARDAAAASWKAQRALLRAAVVAARRRLGVPPAPSRRVAAARRAAAFVFPEGERHVWQWDGARDRFRCARCHRRVRRLPPPANRCLRAHPALARILTSGAALGHCLHVCAVQGRMAGVLALCTRCGAHGAECVRLLGRPCPGRVDGRGGSLRAVTAGRHPTRPSSWVECVWDPGVVAAAAGHPPPPAAGPPG